MTTIVFEDYDCGVCGSPSTGEHFGAITCEGCKVILKFYKLIELLDLLRSIIEFCKSLSKIIYYLFNF